MPTTTAPAEARFRAMGSDVHVLVERAIAGAYDFDVMPA